MVKEFLQDRLFCLFEDAPDGRSIQTKDWLAVGSLKGLRESNQDRACVAHLSYATRPEDDLLVAVVCDGMGGMSEGGIASTLALSVFVTELAISRQNGEERVRAAMLAANKIVHDRLKGQGGATLTAIATSPRGDCWSVHAGDSRLYSYASGELSLMSQDDTLSGIINQGDREQVEDSQDNRLVQFVGMGADLQPHISKVATIGNQTWILTSDGAHGIGRAMMHSIASNARSSIDLARKVLFVVDAAPLGDNASIVALAPSLFEAPKRYRSGVNLTIWTPLERLELWVEDVLPSDRDQSQASVEVADTDTIPPRGASELSKSSAKPKSKTKTKNKAGTARQAKAQSRGNSTKDDNGAPPSLLNIVFGDEQDK